MQNWVFNGIEPRVIVRLDCMEHPHLPGFLSLLILILSVAKLLGAGATRLGQPAVLGELLAGVLLGGSLLGVIDPSQEVVHLMSELGVLLLLFAIGIETDLKLLVRVGGTAAVVAIAGVVFPFALGYGLCIALGQPQLAAIVVGASLTATSVGITARVFSDLGRLREIEGQVVLGAAVLDDVIGLIILTIVAGLTAGKGVTWGAIATTTGLAFGFLVGTVLIGRLIVPRVFDLVSRNKLAGTMTTAGLILAFGLAWLADRCGLAPIIGAFAAGLLVNESRQTEEVEHGITAIGHFFVPIFFVAVGASVDVNVFNPLNSANHATLLLGFLMILVAMISKFAAGYAPFWFKGRKSVVGVGMIPRGEVGLIFAQMGVNQGVLTPQLFGAVTLMVMATTFVTPPLLKRLLIQKERSDVAEDGISELVTAP